MSTVKNVNSFWWIKPYIFEKKYNVGHSIFSFGHILWLIAIAVLAIVMAKKYKRLDENKRLNIKKIFAILIFILEFGKIAVIGFLYPMYMNQYIPLHLCSVAGMCIIFDALYPNKEFINSWWMFVFLPCGLLALLSPSTTYPWFNFFCIHEFAYHGVLVIYAAMKISSSESKVTYKGLWQSILLPLLMIPLIYYIDITFKQGYMFLTDPSDFPLTNFIWNSLVPKFGNIGYIFGLIIIGLFIFHIVYLVAKLIDVLVKKRIKKN